jgi:threonine 3-dehydrogenase
MRALVKKRAEPGLWLEEVPEPEVGIDDVLIRVDRAGICGTDAHIWAWDAWARREVPVPMIVGHEFVGTVERVGANVREFKPGDVVGGEGHVVCGRCRNCMAGRRHLCKDTTGVGIKRPGAFAERISLPRTNVWLHDRALPRDVAAIFDPFGNAVHAALSFDVLGEDVLITGAGPIGLMAAAIVRHAGARFVVVTDVNAYRLDLARKMGATLAIDPRQEPVREAQRRLGMTEGFDVGLEMSGHPSALAEMLANVCHGARIALLGIPSGNIELDWAGVILNGLTIQGIYGRRMYDTWYKMTVLLQGGVDIAPVVTHRFDHREFEKAFEVVRGGACGKVLLQWGG